MLPPKRSSFSGQESEFLTESHESHPGKPAAHTASPLQCLQRRAPPPVDDEAAPQPDAASLHLLQRLQAEAEEAVANNDDNIDKNGNAHSPSASPPLSPVWGNFVHAWSPSQLGEG